MHNTVRHVAGALLLAGLAFTGCAREDRAEGVSPDASSGRSGEPQYTIAWNQIRRGMTADEVLPLLGHPKTIRVNQISTYWYYSDRGPDGPYVCFDTRPMKVSTWRPPGESKPQP